MGDDHQTNVPLLEDSTEILHPGDPDKDQNSEDIVTRVWIESKKLWQIVGPAVLSRISTYSVLVISQVFAGHLGDLDLAAVSIALNVIIGFDFGLMMGMASALETLCGQAYGAKKHYMLGVYLQRSWMVLFICCVLLLPALVFASSILKVIGEPDDLADLAGVLARWLIPLHFSLAFYFPLQRFLQSQVKARAIMWVAMVGLAVHVAASWVFVGLLKMGVVGIAVACNISWWVLPIGLMAYTTCGGCPNTWTGFSVEALTGLWDFLKLSAASGVMLCLENWYYKILIVMTGNMKNAKIEVDALSICMSINGLEIMIPLAFFAGTGVRVANELGAGNGKGAKFAAIVSSATSLIIGLVFCCLIVLLRDKFGLLFSSSTIVLQEVNKLSILLAFTILFNSVQPVLSGVAVGSGWQSYVAYINLGCYYFIGLPVGMSTLKFSDLGVKGIWMGMIFGGTGIQTLILLIITIRCDWEGEAKKASLRMQKWSDQRFERKG
ncbi:protein DETOXIFICATION 27-like isoform X1 [Cucurbita moschata]|uniref:Protein DETOXIFICATION n=2 Tax=Cucurbita moschata TaxID=3662 RepID=A0A6J1GGD2_CUCMO|nr:protein DETOXIFICATION 27-like isoform X1 [Cucurbita moschata]